MKLKINMSSQELSPSPTFHNELQQSAELQPDDTYTIFTNPYERMEYMHYTDDLIATLDGTADAESRPYDAVIYLDSSARPVNWMVSNLWDFAARKDESGNVVAKPSTYFANIDARRTSRDPDTRLIQKLHDTYPQLAAWDEADQPAGQRILVVDEIAVSGDTLEVARQHLQNAYQNLTFNTYAWQDERANVSNGKLNNVRWYERDVDRYRLVLDGSEISDATRAELQKRGLAAYGGWLAVANPRPAGAKTLHDEVIKMTDEVKAGVIPFWPSFKRPIDNIEASVAEQNGGISLKDFTLVRQWMKRYYAPSPKAAITLSDTTGPLTERQARSFLDDRDKRQGPPKLTDSATKFLRNQGYLRS